jgi:hypothetical protein
MPWLSFKASSNQTLQSCLQCSSHRCIPAANNNQLKHNLNSSINSKHSLIRTKVNNAQVNISNITLVSNNISSTSTVSILNSNSSSLNSKNLQVIQNKTSESNRLWISPTLSYLISWSRQSNHWRITWQSKINFTRTGTPCKTIKISSQNNWCTLRQTASF